MKYYKTALKKSAEVLDKQEAFFKSLIKCFEEHGNVPDKYSDSWHMLKESNRMDKNGKILFRPWKNRPIVRLKLRFSALIMTIMYHKKQKMKRRIKAVYQPGYSRRVVRGILKIKPDNKFFHRCWSEFLCEK